MTDTIIDDDIIEVTKPTTSGSNSSISTTRRPMFIETEVRTDTVTKRRVGSSTTAHSRSVYDVLQNTKSPTDGLPPTSYTYAHSLSYMPVTQNGSYDVPVMARRDLHGEYRPYASTSFSSAHPSISSPARFISNVKSQLVNSYSAIRDRLTHHHDDQGPSDLLNSSLSQNENRFSQSTTTTTNGTTHRRPTPTHSTPRDSGSKSHERRTRSTQGKSHDDHEEDNVEQHQHRRRHSEDNGTKDSDQQDSSLVWFIKKLLHFPLDVLSFLWRKIPWWILLPLGLLFLLYALPYSLCGPLEHYPESKLYQNCRQFEQYANNVTNNTITFLRENTVNRGFGFLKRIYHSIVNVKDTLWNWYDDLYVRIRKFFVRGAHDAKTAVDETITDTTKSVKDYCDAGITKVNSLIEELKREKEKLFGGGHGLKPSQEKEFEFLIRQVIDDYAADETGQADYALEANGGKIVDTRCTEYTDEPRQNVVKFLGIPIVHMSKHPDIMIKAGRMPGQCFPFKGDQGSVVIKLAVPIKPTEFTLEHLSKSISIVGHINSAPNNFTVTALKDKHDKEGTVLGRYFYDAENGPSLQRFKPKLPNVPIVEYIELRVTSNWGNPNYTCVYRFRVHGDLQSIQPSAPPAAA